MDVYIRSLHLRLLCTYYIIFSILKCTFNAVKNKILITYWDHDILSYLHEYRIFVSILGSHQL